LVRQPLLCVPGNGAHASVLCHRGVQCYKNWVSSSQTLVPDNILQYLTNLNEIEQNFTPSNNVSWQPTKFHSIKQCFPKVSLNFANYCFRFWWFQKSPAEFWSSSDNFKFWQFQTWPWQKMKMSIPQLPSRQISS
jgi:hypothetical protein